MTKFDYLIFIMLKKILKNLRLILINNQREKKLAEYFCKIILNNHNSKKIKILDFGSGYEPKIAFYLLEKLNNSGKKVFIDCYDFYKKKELIKLNNHKNINFINLKNLKFNKKKYDFSLICDVIHHIGVEKENILKKILINLKLKSKFILIKDHFENGFFSRTILRCMDFIGNYYNNVNIPNKYFKEKEFSNLIDISHLKIHLKIIGLRIYSRIFFFAHPKFQFIYLLK